MAGMFKVRNNLDFGMGFPTVDYGALQQYGVELPLEEDRSRGCEPSSGFQLWWRYARVRTKIGARSAQKRSKVVLFIGVGVDADNLGPSW